MNKTTRFRDLLRHSPGSSYTPAEEQQLASKGLEAAVMGSHLHWWKGRDTPPPQGASLLLGVAPFSQYDMTFLDFLDGIIGCGCFWAPVPVYVTNLMTYRSAEEVAVDFPGMSQVPQTPVVLAHEFGIGRKTAFGKQARDLVAQYLGIHPAEMAPWIKAETPRYTGASGH